MTNILTSWRTVWFMLCFWRYTILNLLASWCVVDAMTTFWRRGILLNSWRTFWCHDELLCVLVTYLSVIISRDKSWIVIVDLACSMRDSQWIYLYHAIWDLLDRFLNPIHGMTESIMDLNSLCKYTSDDDGILTMIDGATPSMPGQYS